MKLAFWAATIGIALPFYAYAGYPLALFLLASVVQTWRDARYLVSRAERRRRSGLMPKVSIIFAAYNEETVIERTIRNCLALDYPNDRLEIIVGSDCSDDATESIVQRFSGQGVRLLAFSERRGKLAVITDCAAEATGDILILSDANTVLAPDAIRTLIRHFENPLIGAVCGELRLTTPEGAPRDEGAYWRYELVLKILESRLDSVLGANGAFYGIRKELFPRLPSHLITDDFVIPMQARARGFRVIYDPEAIAFEEAPADPRDEFRRRVRIGAGNWQALWRCRALLLPWKGFVSFAFWSHKVLRWMTPFLLPIAFASNLFLLDQRFWQVVLVIQCAGYSAAALGAILSRARLRAGPFRIAYYFVLINAAIAIGMVRGAMGLQRPAWQRTARRTAAAETAS